MTTQHSKDCKNGNRPYASNRYTKLLFPVVLLTVVLVGLSVLPLPSAYAGSGDLIRNADFETGTLSPWERWIPSGARGIAAVESCCGNHTPGGRWNAYIQPEGQFVALQQPVSVTVGQTYHLEAWVSTYGMTAYLDWWSNAGGATRGHCGSTNATWPTYVRLSCNFTVPSGTTYFNVQLNGTAPAGKWAVTDDWYLTPIKLHNVIQANDGNYYGSSAYFNWTNPDLREGQWTYHRTATVYINPGTCDRYSEIGWRKLRSGFEGLAVSRWGCGPTNRRERSISLSPGTYRFSQQYHNIGDGIDRYAWFVNDTYIESSQTNFSYSTRVTCGGEVATGVETMGNTRCYQNEKILKRSDGSLYRVPWGGHYTAIQDLPYINNNDPSDPNNAFHSTGPIPSQ